MLANEEDACDEMEEKSKPQESHLDTEIKDKLLEDINSDDSLCRILDDVTSTRHSQTEPKRRETESLFFETGNRNKRELTDPRALESVYEYTNRIKFFLGWNNDSQFSADINQFVSDGEGANDLKAAEDECSLDSSEIICDNKELIPDSTVVKKEGCLNHSEALTDKNVTVHEEKLQQIDNEKLLDVNTEISQVSEDNSNKFFSLNTESKELSLCSQLRVPENPELFDSNSQTLSDKDMNGNLQKGNGPGVDLFDSEQILRDESNIYKKEFGQNLVQSNSNPNSKKMNGITSENSIDEEVSKPCIEHETDETDEIFRNKKLEEKTNMSKVRNLSGDIVKYVLKSAEYKLEAILNDQNKTNLMPTLIHENEKCQNDGKNSVEEQEDNPGKEIENSLPGKNIFQPKVAEISKNSFEKNADADNKLTSNFTMQLKNNIAEKPESNNSRGNGSFVNNNSCTKSIDEESKECMDEDIICGIGWFKPRCLQPWATARTYLILYSITGVLQGSYYTCLIGAISTLEKRFAFKSKVSGIIMMVDEITPLFLGILVGYFGSKTHRPRMVALGMLMSAACCFVTALPYFIYGPAHHLTSLAVQNDTGPELCNSETGKDACDLDDRPPTMAAVLFFMLGSFLKGFGNLAYYAIGLAYMDDNAKKKNTPIYFAVALALRLLGPLVGFLMSSAFLKFYENPFDDPGFGPEDPRWIGGWWMGFLLQGILLVIFAIPMSLFPRRLPGQSKPKVKHVGKESVRSMFLGLFSAVKRLAKNPLFIFLIINTIMTVFGTFGHYIMLPKYMENQFRLSASNASLLSGPPGLIAVMISTVFGGILIWKYKPSTKSLLVGMVILEMIAAAGYLILMIPRCNKIEMANIGMNDEGLLLGRSCNFNCNCSTTAFTPVCGSDGKTTYFSPCYAGCSEIQEISLENKKVFDKCSCVANSSEKQSTVNEGFCVTDDCWSQALAYIITLPILQTITSTLRVSHTMILLRSIHPDDKGVALGTFEAFVCLLGFIPFPITYGAIVDSACLIWEKSCGQTGNCWFYDMDRFNKLLHGTSTFFSSLSVLCLITIYFMSGRVRNLYEDGDDEHEDVNSKAIEANAVSANVTKL